MFLDWTLASLHHLAVFGLAAILAFELALTAGEVDAPVIARLARVDAWYGAMAAVALAAGVVRVFLGARGPDYYEANGLFWIKMALFALVAAISTLPTLRYIVWRRATRADATFRPELAAVAAVRRALWSEAALFAFIPLAAAGMARGYGIWG
jgi:putative membrane protein